MNSPRENRFIGGLQFGAGVAAALVGILGAVLYAQSLNTFAPGQVVSAASINSNFALLNSSLALLNDNLNRNVSELNARVAPVGGIIAWHKSLTGTPGLPAGWVECNGQVIVDGESPLNGQVAPDLNSAPNAWNSAGYYLRGFTASGGTQVDVFQGHRHWRNPTNRSEHDMRLPAPGGTFAFNGTGFHPVDQFFTGDSAAGLYGAPRPGSETRPVSFLVVWIMRVK